MTTPAGSHGVGAGAGQRQPSLEPRGIDRVVAALARFDGEPRNLLVGTPGFAPPEVLLESLRRAAAEPHFGYGDNRGSLALREAIAAVHAKDGEDVHPDRIFVTQGAKLAALAVLGTMLGPGDEVIVPTPCYPPYRTMPGLFGAKSVFVEREKGTWRIDPARVAKAITDRTRAMLVTSPDNPTGAALSEADARALMDLAQARGIRLISDEAYCAFVYDERAVSSLLPFDPEGGTVTALRSVSKTYGLCGWRIGWVVADRETADRLTRFQASYLNPANTLMQRALEALPEVDPDFRERAAGDVRTRLAAFGSAFDGSGIDSSPPGGGFYLMLDLTDAMAKTGHVSSVELCVDLAAKTGLAIWPGEDYFAPATARVSVASMPRHAAASVRDKFDAFFRLRT